MQAWLIWIALGAVMIFLELIVPGGIIVFLGLASISVGAALYYELVTTTMMALLTWFITSIFFIIFFRSFFIKYFEGDSTKQNVDEDADLVGSLVEVVEDIFSYKDGRVKFRDSTWTARSNEDIAIGSKARIVARDGNNLVVKSL